MKEERVKRHARCEVLKKYLQTIIRDAANFYHDPEDPDKPRFEISSAEEKQELIEKTQAQIEQWC